MDLQSPFLLWGAVCLARKTREYLNNLRIKQGRMECSDSIVRAVVESFLKRSAVGVARTDLSTQDWIQHAQEELMDGILYLEKLKQTMRLQSNSEPSPNHS
jgi:hypothetical protein